MKTMTLRLPDELAAEIEAESRAQGRSKSEVVRDRLRSANGAGGGPTVDPLASIRDLIGSVDGLPPDLSARKKEYLKLTGYGRKRRR